MQLNASVRNRATATKGKISHPEEQIPGIVVEGKYARARIQKVIEPAFDAAFVTEEY